ncbi:MAG: VWA domain-containing protein [Spirochaetaceae bacterium]|nr:VWA domain-containing protein [Spirochaetaceae bacterium]
MIIGNFSALYLLLLIPLIILLHIILRRMEKHEIASIFIWKKIKRKRKYSFPTFLILLIQILIICAFVLSLADISVPFTLKLRKENTVLIIDNSASMNVIEDGKSRLDDAREKAINVIKSSSGEIMIITSSYPPQIIHSYSNNRVELINSINSIKRSELSNGIEEAMKIASASVTPNGSIIMISDGAFNYVPSETDNFKFIRAGKEEKYNLGITDFNLREKGFKDAYELYMTISNFSDKIVPYRLELHRGDNILENIQSEILSGEVKQLIFDIDSPPENEIFAELKVDDLLLSDNRASAYISSYKRKKILLITPGNFFLEKALYSLPDISIEKYTGMLESDTLDNVYTSSGIPVQKIPENFDVVIFDRIPPPQRDESGRFIYIDIIPSGIRSEQNKVTPQAVSINKNHPVLSSVDFNNVTILKAWPPLSGPQIDELVSGGNTGLLYIMDSKYLKFVYLPFDLTDSDLPLRSTFPILIKNSIDWLTENYGREEIYQYNTGDIFSIGASNPLFNTSEITDPDGNKFTIENNEFKNSIKTGLYKFEYADEFFFGSININNGDESDISSRFPEVTEEDREEKTGEYKFPIITLLLILTLLLLLTEWMVQENKW